MLRAALAFVLLSVIGTPSWAQAPKSIDPGMSEAKVVERLGQPDVSRTSGDLKYLFYHNDCIKQCGMDDVVILQKDSVVDAMFRAADRSYTGKSSSPRSIPAEVASRQRRGAHDDASVVQAGAPKTDSALAPAPSAPDSAKKPASTPDTTAKTAAPATHSTKKRSPKPRTVSADTVRHDSISGTIRIPVKPPNFSPKRADSSSARHDSTTKQPPHQE
ncbi:MAG TPA: hypothetical protein VGH98_05480 [Gemmatimonadaceae bacterium]|jgi:hypothetical protein